MGTVSDYFPLGMRGNKLVVDLAVEHGLTVGGKQDQVFNYDRLLTTMFIWIGGFQFV